MHSENVYNTFDTTFKAKKIHRALIPECQYVCNKVAAVECDAGFISFLAYNSGQYVTDAHAYTC